MPPTRSGFQLLQGSGAQIDKGSPQRRSARRLILRAAFPAISFAASVGIMWPVLILPSPPSFRHDWIWPLFTPSWSALWFGYSAWSPQNLGSSNLYPTTAPLVAWIVVTVNAFGPRLALDLFCVLIALAASAGASFQFRTFFPDRRAVSAAAGVAYLAIPAFTDELIAGHYGDLIAFAAVPWFTGAVIRYCRNGDLRCGAVALFAAAVCAIEVQFLVLVPLMMLVWVAVFHSRRALLLSAAVLVLLAATNAATVFQIIATHADRPLLNEARTTLSWVAAQSAPWVLAVRGEGYGVGYDQQFPAAAGALRPAMELALFLLPFSLIGLLRIRPARELFGFAFIGFIGVIMVSGTRGPAHVAISWFFLNFKAASLMRELFHAVPLYGTQLALGWVLSLDVVFRKMLSNRGLGLIAALGASFVLGAGEYLGAAHGLLHAAVITSGERRFVRSMHSYADAPWRAVVQPGRQPSTNGRGEGVDPLAYYPFGEVWNMFEYFPLRGEGLASDLYVNGQVNNAMHLYELMSAKYFFSRPGVHVAISDAVPDPLHLRFVQHKESAIASERFFQNQQARPELYGAGFPILSAGDYSLLLHASTAKVFAFMLQRPAFLKAGFPYRLGATNSEEEAIAQGCDVVSLPRESWASASPMHGWHSAWRYGLQDPALDYPVTPAMVTQDFNEVRKLAGSYVLAANVSGRRDEKFSWGFAPSALRLGDALAVAAIARRREGQCPVLHGTRRSGRVSGVVFRREFPTRIRGSFRLAGAGGTLVFTDAYDRGWRLRLDGVPVAESAHFVANGFANGWVVTSKPGIHRFEVVLRGEKIFRYLSVLEIWAWITISVALLLAWPRFGRTEALMRRPPR